MPTYMILYGITEGPWHGRKLRRAAESRGWKPTETAGKADIIISHSGGVFFIPKLRREQHVLLIDPTCTSDRTSFKHAVRFVGWEVQHMILTRQFPSWFWRMLHNSYYSLVHWTRTREIIQRSRTQSIQHVLQHKNAVISQSDNRAWFDTATTQSLAAPHKPKIHFVSAGHDDCWINPDRYLDLVA